MTILKGAPQRDRRIKPTLVIFLLAVGLLFTSFWSLNFGAVDTSGVSAVWLWLFDSAALSQVQKIVVFDIRLPRIILGCLVGAALAIAGVMLQGLFRNPLADPSIIGVTAGASLGAVCAIVFGSMIISSVWPAVGLYLVPLTAFAGGACTTFLLYYFATYRGQTSVATLLLAGIAIAALVSALTGLLIFVANDEQLRDFTFWSLGSLAGATWSKVVTVGPVLGLMIFSSPLFAVGLNAFALGEAEAKHLGIRIQLFKSMTIANVALGVGAAVAVSGSISFIGIVAPHLLRLVIGPDNRFLLPASALLGAVLLLLADALARQIVAPAELPIGILTAAFGAPFFLAVLLMRRGQILEN